MTTRQLEPQRVVGYFLDRERTDRIVKKPLLEKYKSSYQPGYREDGSRIPGGAEERAFNYCIPMYSQLVDNINRNINE